MKKVLINIAYKSGSMSEMTAIELRGICGKYLDGGSYDGSGYDGRTFDCALTEGCKLGTMFFTYNGLMEDKDICNFEKLLLDKFLDNRVSYRLTILNYDVPARLTRESK